MSVEKKKNYRLFKVAKELNVGSSTLVDHLSNKGFEISNSPNEKLNGEMYMVLLREFSSEKVLKQKAEQIKEAKQEKRQQAEEAAELEEEVPLSAEQLRSGFLDGRKQPATPKTEPNKQEPVAEKPPVEAPKAPEEKASMGLKVKGKIDLDSIGKKSKPKAKAKPETPKVETPAEAPKAETPESRKPSKEETPKVEKAPEVKAEAPKEKEVKKEVEKPVAKTETPAVEEKKPAAEKQPVAEKKAEDAPKEKAPEEKAPAADTPPTTEKPTAETPAVSGEETPAAEGEAGSEEEAATIKAADHSPKLAGLTVKGKIDLNQFTSKKPKAKTGESTSEEEKKKRKRKRKRKKPTTGTSTSSGNNTSGGGGGNNRGGNRRGNSAADRKKKEDMSEKEINDIIKSTLADLRKGSGRSRQRLRKGKRDIDARRRENEAAQKAEDARTLEVTEFITANELANMIDVSVTEIISKCLELGLFVSINQRLEADVIQLLTEEYGFDVRFIDIADKEFDDEDDEDDEADLVPRAPIITVMGHVDHGKTSLLDYIRKAKIASGEAGGITQHIGAYEVEVDGKRICFLDTPGHEAFTAMRARGAKVTDLVIIVIAADDQVMPQTTEAINHAEAAGVPMVFAINKIDKDGANSERIRTQLSERNILVEDWGGKFQCQEISAKSGVGIDELLEKVILESELLELQSNPEKSARGTVIEARLDKGRGVVATVLVQDGTLKVTDSMVGGVHFGRVRAMMDEHGQRIKSAGPSTPVQILGLMGTPQAGDRFIVYEDERKAKDIALRRSELYREQQLRQNKRPTLEEVARRKALGDFKELNIIVKGDVDGSVEALSDSLLKLSQEEVAVKVIHKAVGQITEADVLLATASDAIIIGFQVRPSINARRLADNEGVDVRLYSVIYDAINQVRDALEGLLSPEQKEDITGTAEIREVFKVTKVGTIAGCMVLDGTMNRKDPIRVIREGIVIYQGKLGSLKRFKDDVKDVHKGFECGIQVDGYNDIQLLDVIEQFKTTEVARKLR